MRLFFGLEASPELAMQIADWRDRQFGEPGRPVPPANFHITLAFIGDVNEQGLEALASRVDHWVERKCPRGACLTLDHTGYWHKPGIYWLGPAEWPEELDLMVKKLRGLSFAAGGKRDRNRFQPHVTLFRSCLRAPPAPSHLPDFCLTYDHFTLFESRQGKSGMIYQAIESWLLDPPLTATSGRQS